MRCDRVAWSAPVKLYGLSDLHVGYAANRRTLSELPAHPEDWLVLAGDIGENERQLAWTLDTLGPRFARLIWVPGNHDLWTDPRDMHAPRGEQKYLRLVELCRSRGVLTPEDPYVDWHGEGGFGVLAPLFLLYDYSFRPDEVPLAGAVDWARSDGVMCADERLLQPDPYPSREEWCARRVAAAELRLGRAALRGPLVLINHWPLRRDLVRLRRIPRFSVWCGTRRTEDWHLRFGARVVVSGHLHVRATDWRDGVRFEEVSLGYPDHWRAERGAHGYLREILPGPERPGQDLGTIWHR
jgi:3',5'-cyclic AMP phosphodiesterase CpdA